MKILIVGEGKHDIGARTWCQREKCYIEKPGWLQTLMFRIKKAELDISITAIRRSELKLTDQSKRRLMPLPEGHGAKALAAMQKAVIEGYDVVIFMADLDSNEEKDWYQHIAWMHAGYSKLNTSGSIVGIACLPKSTSESWMLSDVDAWVEAGLEDDDAAAMRSLSPEMLWGIPSDPNGNHPKQVFSKFKRKICENCDETETRVKLINSSNPSIILSKCSISFRGFLDECRGAGISY